MLLAESLLGTSSVAANFIEDVFSTYLYKGNSSTQTITNGIDLSGKGGLVWIKDRSNGDGYHHILQDTARGASWCLFSNLTVGESQDAAGDNFAFNSNGFYVGTANAKVNASTDNYASWTFRKQAKFFDVVTYTGNGVAGRTVAHNLGSVPGCIIVKRTDGATNWRVYHRSLGATQYLDLDETVAAGTATTIWNDTAPTATVFSVGTNSGVNANGGTYVAYLFAHNAGGFGASGSDNVISCGSYTGTGAAGNFVSLGYEPQWLLIKRSDAAQDWFLFDNMRGLVTGTGGDLYLNPNLSDAEGASGTYVAANATGFTLEGVTTGFNASGGTYIYIAIRRGPMKKPTSGTSVFSPIASSAATGTALTTGFPVDAQIFSLRSGTTNKNNTYDRLRGVSSTTTESGARLITSSTAAETAAGNETRLWDNTGFQMPSTFGGASTVFWNFGRAPGFFDVVCYTGTGGVMTVNHNLAAVPEMMIFKNRQSARSWPVYTSATGNTQALILNSNAAVNSTGNNYFNSTSPTSTVFTVNTAFSDVGNVQNMVAYLFATVAGVSKVFSYTGNGSSQTINCGFTGGARFVLIKRTDSTGDWYVWDSARGIVAANDPRLSLNSTAAEVTTDDSVDTDSSGFIVNQVAATNINVNAATYIGLAIA